MRRLGERATARRGVQSDESPELRESGRYDASAAVWPHPWPSEHIPEFRRTSRSRQFRTRRRVDPRFADWRTENPATSVAFRVVRGSYQLSVISWKFRWRQLKTDN